MFGHAVLGAAFGLALVLPSCIRRLPPPPPPRPPHYVVGDPYQSAGEWRYPRAFDNYDMTGLATVLTDQDGAVTLDNESFDAQALAAASPVLQLPAIITVTNLANGYTLDVRVNERGPDDPGRILAVTPQVAKMLRFPDSGIAQVEVVLKPRETAALDGTLGQGPKLTAAPLAGITAQSLAPPGQQSSGATQNLTPVDDAGPATAAAALSGRLTAVPPSAGPLYVQIPGFGRERDARRMQNTLYGFASVVVPASGGDRVLYAVNVGPYQTVAAADAAMRQIIAQGVTDPQIIVR